MNCMMMGEQAINGQGVEIGNIEVYDLHQSVEL